MIVASRHHRPIRTAPEADPARPCTASDLRRIIEGFSQVEWMTWFAQGGQLPTWLSLAARQTARAALRELEVVPGPLARVEYEEVRREWAEKKEKVA